MRLPTLPRRRRPEDGPASHPRRDGLPEHGPSRPASGSNHRPASGANGHRPASGANGHGPASGANGHGPDGEPALGPSPARRSPWRGLARLRASLARLASDRRRVRLLGGALLVAVAVASGVAGAARDRARQERSEPFTPVPASPALAGNAVGARRGSALEYERRFRRNDAARVSRATVAPFRPLYRIASRTFGVSWRLIASVHKQETAFSTSPDTYHGLNFAGCCAGPMQFNVTNGPVTTWDRFKHAYRRAPRPAAYPHPRPRHPSPYDDFDAIMAAASLLASSGAGRELSAGSWQAAYDYYGHDETGVLYANQVLARAIMWEREGFCPQCEVDPEVLDAVAAAYAPAEPPRRRARSRRRDRRKAIRAARRARRRAEARERRLERIERERRRARRREIRRGGRGREPSVPPAAERPRPPAPAPAERPAAPPVAADPGAAQTP